MRITRGSLRLCMVFIVVFTALYFQFFVIHVISHHHRHHDDLLLGLSVEKNNNIGGGSEALSQVGPNPTTRSSINNSQNKIILLPPSALLKEEAVEEERCAINLYGLPRAFASIVLPSLVQNVIKPNADYHCDYFIHYYNLTNEIVGRFGQGGDVNPEQILLLQEKVLEQYSKATVVYGTSQEAHFWEQYATLLDKIHNTKDSNGHYVYFPWKAQTYKYPTTLDNIIKMWHSIQSVWNLMEQHAAAAAGAAVRPSSSIRYTRVAMLRSDVMYLTPIDIWAESDGIHRRNVDNDQAVIPGFGKHPVSDRLIYGPYDAVKIWATMRFPSMDEHAQWMHDNNPGWAMHSERFVKNMILSRIQNLGFKVTEHDSMCFFRARVDESIWITDCGGDPRNSIVIPTLPKDVKSAVEKVLGRSCGEIVQVTGRFKALQCPKKKVAEKQN